MAAIFAFLLLALTPWLQVQAESGQAQPDKQYTYDEDRRVVVEYHDRSRRVTAGEAFLALLAALGAGGITVAAIVGKYRLKWGGYRYSCRENGRVELTEREDRFVNQIVTRRRIPRQNSHMGSGGRGGSRSRSTTHVGSGGRRSGGGSRRF